MHKAIAIKILREQKLKLEDLVYLENLTWTIQTAKYIKEFFGEDSSQSHFIQKFSFIDIYDQKPRRDQIIEKLPELKAFIDDCIETITKVGLTKRKNFLTTLSDTWLTFLISAALGGAFYGGKWVGERSIPPLINFSKKESVDSTSQASQLKKIDSIPKDITHDTVYLTKEKIISLSRSQIDSIKKVGANKALASIKPKPPIFLPTKQLKVKLDKYGKPSRPGE